MALETWPDHFPKPQLKYKSEVTDPVIRTAMDRGHKARSQFASPIYNVGYTVRMTEEQFKYFQSWHRHKLNNGADWFEIPVRSDGTLINEEVRFRQIYKASHSEPYRVRLSMELEQRTDSVPSSAAYDAWAAAQ